MKTYFMISSIIESITSISTDTIINEVIKEKSKGEKMKLTEAIEHIKQNVDYIDNNNNNHVEQLIESYFETEFDIRICTGSYNDSTSEEKISCQMFYENGSEYSWHSDKKEPDIDISLVEKLICEFKSNCGCTELQET